MIYLAAVSLFWAFSFGLIKGILTGIPSGLVSFIRVFLAFLTFLPFFRKKNLDFASMIKLAGMGAVQYGLMYLTYIYSFQFLQAYEVALFTIFTPLFVTLLSDAREKKLRPLFWLAALLTIAGTGVIVYRQLSSPDFLKGFLILQLSNFCFALGQVEYKAWMKSRPGLKDVQVFALLYAGASLICLPFAIQQWTVWQSPALSAQQFWVLIYLGILASGVCFFLWNLGARKVNSGSLAVFNNVKIPLAILVSLLFFHENAPLIRLGVGGGLVILSLLLTEKKSFFRR